MFTSKGARFDLSENFHVKVHGCELMMSPGHIILRNGSGAAIGLHGGTIQIICPSGLRVTSGDVKVNAGTGEVEILGSTINLG
jgi:hypothetical protein